MAQRLCSEARWLPGPLGIERGLWCVLGWILLAQFSVATFPETGRSRDHFVDRVERERGLAVGGWMLDKEIGDAASVGIRCCGVAVTTQDG